MTDIVERLRDHVDHLLLGGDPGPVTQQLIEEAANEIERLRYQIARAATRPATEA